MDHSRPLPPPLIQAEPVPEPRGNRKVPLGMTESARSVLRWAYTNNPFYVISAALVFSGLRMSFDTGGPSFATGALMVGLTSYTLLLAAAAWLLIRFGRLWEDARTVLLLIVLMFLATSVSFDETLAANTRLGVPLFVIGLVFAVGLSEGLLRGIRLSLPTLFRLPYHLMLSLFFLYPVALSLLIRDAQSPTLHWGLFGFAAVAGFILFALLPAIRRGPEYVRDNGSPWPWPWYPWLLFGVLGFGVCVRSHYLCVSLHFVAGSASIFGLYFLVPFLFAANILLLEAGVVSQLGRVTRLALVAPAGLLALAMTGSPESAADLGFLERFTETLGASPLYLTLIATLVFYVVAMVRRIPHASTGLMAALAALAVCGPGTFHPASPAEPVGLPILLVAGLQLAIALRRRSAPRTLVAACCLVAALSLDFRGTAFTAHLGLIPFHLLLAAVLLIGARFRGAFALAMQRLGAAGILLAGVGSVTCDPRWLGHPPPGLLAVYPLLAVAAAAAYGYFVGNRWYFAVALGILGGWLATAGWQAYRHLRQTMAGLGQIAWGVMFFLLAIIVSLTKTGLPRRWLACRRKQNGDRRNCVP